MFHLKCYSILIDVVLLLAIILTQKVITVFIKIFIQQKWEKIEFVLKLTQINLKTFFNSQKHTQLIKKFANYQIPNFNQNYQKLLQLYIYKTISYIHFYLPINYYLIILTNQYDILNFSLNIISNLSLFFKSYFFEILNLLKYSKIKKSNQKILHFYLYLTIIQTLHVYSHSQIYSSNTILSTHQNTIYATSISFYRNTIVSASQDTFVNVHKYNSSSNQYQLFQSLSGHTSGVHSVKITDDQSMIVSGGADSFLKIWIKNTISNHYILFQSLSGHNSNITRIWINTNKNKIISCSLDYTIKIWVKNNLGIFALNYSLNTSSMVHQLSISIDQTILTSALQNKSIQIWILSNDNITFQLNQTLSVYTQPVISISISQDGSTIVTGSSDNNIVVWKSINGSGYQYNQTLNGHSGTVHTIDCNYDGSQIISGSNDTTMKYWYLNTWGNYQLNYTFTGSGKPIYGLDFSSDQIIIASGGDDKKLWTWKYSLSCSNILNTNGSFNSTVCFCKSGYSWNYRNFSCNLQNLNCLTQLYSTGLIDISTQTCICITNYTWNNRSKSCSLDCSNSLFSNGSNYNQTSCLCNNNYIWNNNQCSYNCLLDAKSNSTNNGTDGCFCLENYSWSTQYHQCLLLCNLFSNTVGINTKNQSQCLCVSLYIWNSIAHVCQVDCTSKFNSNKLNINFNQCGCISQYIWNITTFNCQFTTNHTTNNSSQSSTNSSNITKVPSFQLNQTFFQQTLHSIYGGIIDLIAVPNIGLMITILRPFISILDDFSYYIYHKRQYNQNLVIFYYFFNNITTNKWLPSYLSTLQSIYDFQNIFKISFKNIGMNKIPSKFKNLGLRANFIQNTSDYWQYSLPLSFLGFAILNIISKNLKIKKIQFLINLIQRFTSYTFLLISIIGQNIQYLSFHCFSQIYFLIPSQLSSCFNLILVYTTLFILIIYTFVFYAFLKYLKYNQRLYYTEEIMTNQYSFLLMTLFVFTKFISGFIHAALYEFGFIQIALLLLVNICLLSSCIVFRQLFSSKYINTILITQYLLSVILHLLFMIEHILIWYNCFSKQQQIVFGNIEIYLIILIVSCNLLELLNFYNAKKIVRIKKEDYENFNRKKIIKNRYFGVNKNADFQNNINLSNVKSNNNFIRKGFASNNIQKSSKLKKVIIMKNKSSKKYSSQKIIKQKTQQNVQKYQKLNY